MKKKLLSLAAGLGLLGGLALMSAPSTTSLAACQEGPTEGEVIATNPADGGVIYSDGTTYGSMGAHGYIEGGTDGHIQGSSTDIALEGKGTATPSLCVNDTVVV